MNRPTFHRVATSLTDLRAEPSFLAERLTQVFNGCTVQILEQRDEWCFVEQSDGYRGWAYQAYLVEASGPAATHLVVVPWTLLNAAPVRAARPQARLPGGTRVHVAETHQGWARVRPAGNLLPAGWARADDLQLLSALPVAPTAAPGQMIEHARQLTGVYYLWGGCTACGIDCSGLAQLVHRLCGYRIPRDSHLQFRAGRPVEPPFCAGDLLFFHAQENRDKITHVGLSTGGWQMIHSSRSRNGVYEEDVEQMELRHRFAGARRFIGRVRAEALGAEGFEPPTKGL